MTLTAFIAVAVGGTLGCWLRWMFSIYLNSMAPSLPLGTLAANLIGGYLVGLAVAFFGANTSFAPEWRLACITGFLGGLTTFSTFSAENVQMLLDGRLAAATAHAAAHLFGSLVLTAAGIATFRALG